MRSRLLKNFLLGLVGAVVIAVAISLFTAVTATPHLSYTITSLGTLGDYPITFPSRINDLGQVAILIDAVAAVPFPWVNSQPVSVENLIKFRGKRFREVAPKTPEY